MPEIAATTPPVRRKDLDDVAALMPDLPDRCHTPPSALLSELPTRWRIDTFMQKRPPQRQGR